MVNMTLDEAMRMFPIGARLWHAGFASWCEVCGHYQTSHNVTWINVQRFTDHTNWFVPPEKLFCDENYTPVPACGPGGGAHEHVHQAQGEGETTAPIDTPVEQHVAGHSPEHVSDEVWKAFKEML